MESVLLGEDKVRTPKPLAGMGLCRQTREQPAKGTEDGGYEGRQGLEGDTRPGNLAGMN